MGELPNDRIIYEQPLTERMRAFLRLEHLFQRAEHQLEDTGVWSSRIALETVIDIMAVMGRADLKTELIKELDRHAAILKSLAKNPNVDLDRLNVVLDQIRSLLDRLRARETVPGAELRQNEFLSAVKQRNSIPAGTCDFDLPGYHFWLASPAEQRAADLHRWLSAFNIVRDAVSLCLNLVRESATASTEMAAGGFFQRNLDKGSPYQMVRVAVRRSAPWYPEISAGKHRFTIRFMHQPSADVRPTQTDKGVEFDLLCCGM